VSVNEILVVVGGLAIGYWVVSKLFDDLKKDQQRPLGEQASVQNSRGKSTETWYEVLKVTPEATLEEIRQSYKSLMQQYHPDKVAALGDELKALAGQKSKEINAAYQEALQLRGQSGA
jgi:DnaJ like chaperone protein